MRLITMASLGASAVLGLAALFVAKTALPSMTAQKTAPGAALSQAPVEGTPVVVASKAIGFGERLEAGHLSVVMLPKEAAPAGAFATVEQVLAQDDGGPPVALTPIAQREPVLPAKLSGPGARPSVAAEIGKGMRAFTIKVTDVSGVGGHALPGDRVDVVLTRDLTGGGEQKNLVSEVVIQNVRMLGVDLNADPTSNKPAPPSTATLEVTVKDAQKLAMAATLGELSLALRRTGAAEIEPVAPIRTRDFVSAPGAAGPARAAAPVRRAAPLPRARTIQVVEGDSGDPEGV